MMMLTIKQWMCAATLLAVALASAGCDDKPDASMAEDAILSDISANANKLIELRSFEKTDGIERSIEGRPIYVMEWKAVIVFVGDAWWKADDFSATRSEGEASDVWESFHAGTQGKAGAKAGEKIELSGKTIFERSEKGWRSVGREVSENIVESHEADKKVPRAATPEAVAAPKRVDLTTDTRKFGYSVGVDIGLSIEPVSAHVDIAAIKRGLDDVLSGMPLKLDEAAREQIKTSVTEKMKEDKAKVRTEVASTATEGGARFLAENGKRPEVMTTASGLQYEVLKVGTGASPKATDEVTVHYIGTLINGEAFDSSISRGHPATFPLDKVIPGWTEGIPLMKSGAKYKFYIPSALGYGERGAGAKIGPNATLIFEVELISIDKPE